MAKKEEFNLEDWASNDGKVEVKYKPEEVIPVTEVFAQAMNRSGIKLGEMTTFYGLSDSGKTSLLIHIAAQAQKQGIIPILIITENKMDWNRAQRMGLDISKSKCIIREDLQYLEEVYNYISRTVEAVKSGKLPSNVIMLWDSVASTPSEESMEIDKDGNIKKKYGPQKNAAVIGYYNPIIAKRIASTKQEDSKFSLGLVALTQAYVKPPDFPGAPSTIVPNGGEKIWFPLSLCVEVKEGGSLSATHKGRKITYGKVCKLKVRKDHGNDFTTEGEFVITADELLPNDKVALDAYRETHKTIWDQTLEEVKQNSDTGEEDLE